MADELVRSRSVIGLLDGGLRLWVVARPALGQIILLAGLAIGLLSLLVPIEGDFAVPLRLVLLLAMLVIGEVAGAVTVRGMLDGTELAARSTWGGFTEHWLALVLGWLGCCSAGLVALWLGVNEEGILQVLLGICFALLISLISLLVVTAVVERSGIKTMSRLVSLTKGFKAKSFGLALLWGLAVTVFALLMATWLVVMILGIFSAALGPLQIEVDDPTRWSALIVLGPLMVFAPGSAGVWGLFLIDLRVESEGLDLTRSLAQIDSKR